MDLEPHRISDFLDALSDDRASGKVRPLDDYADLAAGDDLGALLESVEAGGDAREDHTVPDAFAPGDGFGRYTLIEELGAGGQGVVYLAEDPELKRRVALKLLLGLGAMTESAARRFRREAEIVSTLEHPSICTVHEAGAWRGVHYIAMRWIDGETLAQRIAATRAVPGREAIAERVELMEAVARAANHAHGESIVHRDLKPANIMITREGDPIILDFGLALSDRDAHGSLTRTGDVFGTPNYMAPEQIDPALGSMDARTDVYAIGMSLLESVTLSRPFDGPTHAAVYKAVLAGARPDPRRQNPAISRDLRVVINTAMARDPHHRYRTAQELADDLHAVRTGGAISARPTPFAVQIVRWVRRRPAAAVALLLTLLVVGATGAVLANLDELRAQRDAARMVELGRTLDEAFFELGEGEPRHAVTAFRHALTLDPDRPEAFGGLMLALVKVGEPQAALDEAARSELPRRFPELEWARIDALRASGLQEEAALLEERLGEPATALGWFIAGTWKIELGHRGDDAAFLEARRFLRQAIVGAAGSYYFYGLAHAIAHAADDPDAKRDYARALTARWPDSPSAWNWAGFILGPSYPAEGETAYLRCLELDEGNVYALGGLGRLLGEQGRFTDARRLMTPWIDEQPRLLGPLGEVVRLQRNLDEAVRLLTRAIAYAPDDYVSLRRLALTYEQQRKLDLAIDTYRRGVAANPYDWKGHLGLAVVLRENDQAAAAVEAVNRCLGLRPREGRAWNTLGAALEDQRKLADAIDAYEKAIECAPNKGLYRGNLGNALRASRRQDEAVAAYEKYAELAPNDPAAYISLGRMLQECGRLEESSAAYERLVELRPREASAHLRLAWTLLRLGRRDALEDTSRAVEAARTASRLAGGDSPAHLFAYCLALELDDQLDDAVLQAKHALDCLRHSTNPDESLRSELEAALARFRRKGGGQ